jgi:hypothetical protein
MQAWTLIRGSAVAMGLACASLTLTSWPGQALAQAAGPDAKLWLASVPREGIIDFAVERDGTPIGHHRLTFTRQGADVVVDIDIKLEVSFAFIKVYDYHHRNREVWRDGKLVGFETQTDANGSPFKVRATREGDLIAIKGEKYQGPAPGDLLPTSYWNPKTISASELINTQDGRLAKAKVADLGIETIDAAGTRIDARHYRISGDLDLDLWYDRNGMWVKTSFKAPSDGSLISYELRSPVTPSVSADPSSTSASRDAAPVAQP